MVNISIHPLAPATSLVTGFNNVGAWAIEGVVRLSTGSHPSEENNDAPDSENHPASFTATSIKIALNVSAGTSVGTRSESNLMAALGSSGSRDAKWNGIVHMNKDLELVPQTSHGANGVILKKNEVVDLPFRFEFGRGLPPSSEVERGRYRAFSRYRLNVAIHGRPHGLRNAFEPRSLTLDYDVPVSFYDVGQVKKLLEPKPETWEGSTEELDWSITLGSVLFPPNEFTKIFLKASLRNREDAGAHTLATSPTTQAAFNHTAGSRRVDPVPFIRRATFQLVEDGQIQAFQVAQTPVGAQNFQRRGGFDLNLRRKSAADKVLIDRDVGGGRIEIMAFEVDGDNLKEGHEFVLQLPPLAPALPTPGSKMAGVASIDRRMSTGGTTGKASTEVQVNPSGNWGTFQVSHIARITIEVADGHTVLWETPVTVASATAEQARTLAAAYPDYTSLDESVANSVSASNANLEEASRGLLLKAAEMVNSVVRPDVPCVRVDSEAAVAAH
ncbi:uncharacterized protein EV422DRAFT_271003 [Fimicolochytrium jonesii]|uniref:uncharacterized protein n=1 Tax=Fimicolochytrium jonesii TaxID=1396493 RepID=UPI0022FF0243|nr:uncharacterized protein EV422DRAFT_271003 [Fimicolochytrium jonesii]KAI8816824.1 hypothetical protein EV422DRAFT_271003 [Fimicolochytrium jonesii]